MVLSCKLLQGTFVDYVMDIDRYYSKFIEENCTDSRKLFKSVNMLLYRNSDECYLTAKSDTDLACAFADFFMQKIDRLRSEIGRSATELTKISETVQSFSGEMKLQSFKSLTNNEVFRLIKSGTIKSCSLDPLSCHNHDHVLSRFVTYAYDNH